MTDGRWEIGHRPGPVIATAVHAGHRMRPELLERSALSAAQRRREEDPLTDLFVGVGDHTFAARLSRFEVDLNRPEHEAVYLRPSDAWGLELWHEQPTDEMVGASLAIRTAFYDLISSQIETAIAEHGRVLLLDVHSFNHRRGGPDAEPEDQAENPDIDLGLTTADEDRFGGVVEALWEGLAATPVEGRPPDVRRNVRFEDGGHFPEWVFGRYGEDVCTVTLEYKKIFMDEWRGTADLSAVEALRHGLDDAVARARTAL